METNATNQPEKVFIELGGKLCDLVGWRRVIGQVYVILYLADKPLSLDDIGERINMSKSTVWAAIKKLEKLWAVNKAGNRDGKKDSYIAERNLNTIFKNGIIPELSSKLLFAGGYLEQAEKILADFGSDMKGNEKVAKYHNFLNEFAEQRDKLNLFLKQLPLLIDTNSPQPEERR